MRIKKNTKAYSLSDASIKQLEEMMQFYGHNASTMVQIAISECYGRKYRIERYGHQKGTDRMAQTPAQKEKSVSDKIEDFLKMSDADATTFIHDCGYIAPDMEELYKFSIITKGEKRFMLKKSDSYRDETPLDLVIDDLKQFLKDNS